MGGVFNVAFRFRDGSAVCQERWTNNVGWLRDPALYGCDEVAEAAARKYIAMTRNSNFVGDALATGRLETIRHNSYGLVVFDFLSKSLFDDNDYSHLASMDLIKGRRDDGEDIRELCDAGRLRLRVRAWEKGEGPRKGREFLSEPLSFEQGLAYGMRWDDSISADFAAEFIPVHLGEKTFVDYKIDISPMTYYDFSNNWKGYRAKLREVGFPMTRKEGLNKSMRSPPKLRRDLSEREKAARELYSNWVSSKPDVIEEGQVDPSAYDGVWFDDAPKEIRDQFFEHADRVLADPVLSAGLAFGGLFG